jgi:outer membrane biosynthesis protein TonB
VILGITAVDQQSGKSAYKDERISVPCQSLEEFEAGAEAFVEGVLGSRGWYLELQTRIAAQMSAPVAAPSGREKPDFSKMTIGDGYSDFPAEEEEPEEEKVEEEPEEEKVEEEKPAEEAPKPAAKKKATKKKEEEKPAEDGE